MSEGINFSDQLARLVVIVGLPFANPYDPVLREKMNYLDRKAAAAVAVAAAAAAVVAPTTASYKEGNTSHSRNSKPAAAAATAAGQGYYEDMCMNSVNQSIGRAIRHQNDFAAIVLIDHRYTLPRIHSKLPGWICKSLNLASSFGESFGALAQFYKRHRTIPGGDVEYK